MHRDVQQSASMACQVGRPAAVLPDLTGGKVNAGMREYRCCQVNVQQL